MQDINNHNLLDAENRILYRAFVNVCVVCIHSNAKLIHYLIFFLVGLKSWLWYKKLLRRFWSANHI